jgi:hypothetical protein
VLPDESCKRSPDLATLLLADGLPLAQVLPEQVERCLLMTTGGVKVRAALRRGRRGRLRCLLLLGWTLRHACDRVRR